MEQDSHAVKQFIMYTNDAVEATFSDGSKIYLAPCATEYVVQQNSQTQGILTTKHRTIYTTSHLLSRIRTVLTFRNLYAQQPFLVPTLVDSNECYQSTCTATHVRWSPKISLPTISPDDPTQTWTWTSLCGRARIDIPQCRQIVYITHPIQVSRILSKQDNCTDNIPTKYIHIFAPIHRCFSCQKLPNYLTNFVSNCLQLIEQLSNNSNFLDLENFHADHWNFQLPSSLPSSSCSKPHRHRLHNEMMFEADIHILQTVPTITYRLEYDNSPTIEALITDETTRNLVDYVLTPDIHSTFYNYYSIKDKECHLLTLSEHSLPPHNERLNQIIRFMSTMRQRLLSMTRRVQEKPCWLSEDESLLDETIDQLKSTSFEDSFDYDDKQDIFRQTSLLNVGHFKYFHDDHIEIHFSKGFILFMTPEQVHSCQANPQIDFQCRITDRKKQMTVDILDGISEPGCYEQYIIAAIEWCMWILNEKHSVERENLEQHVQQELFRLRLYRNKSEIEKYQQSSLKTPVKSQTTAEYYSPEDIKQLLEKTARFTGTKLS